MRKFFLILVLLASFYLLPTSALADNEFSANYDVHYDVNNDGSTQVTQKIDLKNLTDQYYASTFMITIGSTTISDVTADDNSGPIQTSLDKKDNRSTITLKLGAQVVGVGKTQSITVHFKSRDFADQTGKTWQVSLPKVANSASAQSYNVTLSVPVSFGDPTSISPAPRSQSQNIDRLYYLFTKDQLSQSGVSASFGTTQFFSFNYTDSLINNSLLPASANITLPPNTPYQEVIINSLDPKPDNVTIDPDGNLLAWYTVNKRSQTNVKVSGLAKLYISKRTGFSDQIQSADQYLKNDSYWQKDNPLIKTKLTEILGKDQTATNKIKAQKIYRYVVDTLKYDTNRLSEASLDRLGAVTALNNPDQAVCMEFTDLFIALARAANVPSRELDGYAYTKNKSLRPVAFSENGQVKDFLHAWPEYYDEQKGWVMVDPTWENTSGGVDYFNKFDLNHFVLSIRGVSSLGPQPGDDVKVELSDEAFVPRPQISTQVELSQPFWSGFPNNFSIVLENDGNYLSTPSAMTLVTNKPYEIKPQSFTVGSLPPFGKVKFNTQIKNSSLLENGSDFLQVEVAGQKIAKPISFRPVFLLGGQYSLYAAVGAILSIYLATLAWRFHQKSTSQKS